MKILLITDIHFGENTNYPRLKGEDYINVFGAHFESLFSNIKSEAESCDLVVNLGDFIHDESEEKDIETYRKALQHIVTNTPTKHVAGNHDLRHVSREKLTELMGEEKLYYSFDAGGYHHVVLDGTRTERRGPHYIGEEQLTWLENDLSETEMKTIIYCHYPLDNQNMENNYYFMNTPESGAISNRGFVRKILEHSGKVLAVFNGHTHFYSNQIVNGITYCTIPSFSENDGNHQPQGEYGLITLEGDSVSIEIKRSRI